MSTCKWELKSREYTGPAGEMQRKQNCTRVDFLQTSSLGSGRRNGEHCESRGTYQDRPEDRLALPPVYSTGKDEKRELTFWGSMVGESTVEGNKSRRPWVVMEAKQVACFRQTGNVKHKRRAAYWLEPKLQYLFQGSRPKRSCSAQFQMNCRGKGRTQIDSFEKSGNEDWAGWMDLCLEGWGEVLPHLDCSPYSTDWTSYLQ